MSRRTGWILTAIVLVAAVPGQALIWMSQMQYDLLLLDIEMPGIGGLEVARHLLRRGHEVHLVVSDYGRRLLAEESGVTRLDIEGLLPGRELPGHEGNELRLDDAPLVVPFLRPGVGEVDVDELGRVRRQQVFEEIGGFDPHAAQVRQAGAPTLAIQFPDPGSSWLPAENRELLTECEVLERQIRAEPSGGQEKGEEPQERRDHGSECRVRSAGKSTESTRTTFWRGTGMSGVLEVGAHGGPDLSF